MIVNLTMKPKESRDPAAEPASTKAPPSRQSGSGRAGGPLTELVDDKLNNSLADQIAEELDEKREQPARSGATDYARGTAEHDDDRET